MGERWPWEADDLGPWKVLLISDPDAGLEGAVVVDNIGCGTAIGGVRMAPDVTVAEVARLARAMTFKNAMAGLAHGGGKAGIRADPSSDPGTKEALVRAFARAIRNLDDYIPGPDMGTDETSMAWVHDEIGRAVGLPRVLGGIPLDTIGATGFGLAVCADVAQEFADVSVKGARVAIQGFGAVGRHAARFLEERGAKVVAVADSRGAVADPGGLDLRKVLEFKDRGRSVGDYKAGQKVGLEEFVGVECDVWIPAARPDVLTKDNVSNLKAKLVLQGANIPATLQAEEWMHDHGVLSVPDFVANAGGVICAAVEYRGGTEAQAFTTIEEKLKENTRAVLETARRDKMAPRSAAELIARARVTEAMRYRRQ
ncbi:MAG: Glu/Leu/Phe/Val dehydrogenase [Chloroflexi bacterium]|nr:Glu/Leu/Phe/Val dehydrogenase [Chloroflexota bacterium]